jgi:Fic family protein
MDPVEFQDSPSGRLVPTIGGASAFVPHPLPPHLDLQPIVGLIAEAHGCLGELRGIASNIPNPYLLIRPIQRREAVASSAIEGTITSLTELFLFEAGAPSANQPADAREVLNYVRALESGLRRLAELPVSARLMLEMHDTLLSGLNRERGGSWTPGEFRREQNFIGSNAAIRDARFVPPPVSEMTACLGDLERYINEQSDTGLPLLVRIALIHYQFEAIHPFPDGNGRVGRLLIPIILSATGALPQPLLYLSPYFEMHRKEYVDLMLDVSRRGGWLEWIRFFLAAVLEQGRQTVTRVGRLQELRIRYRELLMAQQRAAAPLALVDHLFQQPFISVPRARDALNVTYKAAQKNVEKLVKAGILNPMPGFTYPAYFSADEIFAIINAD